MSEASADAAAKPSSARSNLVRVIVATLVALVVLLVGAAAGLLVVRHQLTVQSSSILPASNATRAVRQAMADADSAVRAFQLTGEAGVLTPLPQAGTSLQESFRVLNALAASDPTLRARVERQQQAATSWWQRYAAPVAAGHRPTAAAEQQQSATAYEVFRSANTDLTDLIRDRSIQLMRQVQVVVVSVLVGMLAWTAIGALLVLVPAVRTLRLIGPPLEGLEAVVGRLRRGDLAARADPARGVVEIRDVALALNELAAESQGRHERDAEDLRLAGSVREIGAVIGSSLDLPTVVRDAAVAVADRFPAATVWVRVFDDPSDAASTGQAARHPADPASAPPVALVPAGRRIAAAAWRRRTPYLLQPGDADAELLSEDEAEGILGVAEGVGAEAILFVPVGAGPDCLGYLGLGRRVGQVEWRAAEIDALSGVGRDLGRAVVHSRLFERESVLVRELRELDATKNDFVAMVSHELRTPLASIIGHLEIVRSGDLGPVDPEMDPSLRAIDRNAVRLTKLIEDLLLLSRIEQRAQPATLRPLDLAVVARDVVDLHAGPAAEKNTDLSLVACGDPAPVLGDHLELERVLGNLVGNAIKYSPSGSTVRLTLTTTANAVTAAVSDNGIGISPEDLQQLFEKFFRSADPAAQAVSGTGLGLAITQAIVTKHGGAITVKSSVGSGSAFTVTLPRLREADPDTAYELLAASARS